MFDELIAKAKKEDEERGYSEVDLAKVKKRLIAERREWTRRFDTYVELLLHDGQSTSPVEIMTLAARLADVREQLLKEKYSQIED